jgi:hypothetical protein
MRIPFLDLFEQFTGCEKPKHAIEQTADAIVTGHQITALPKHTETSTHAPELRQPEKTQSDTSAATTAVVHFCGYLLLYLLTSRM